MSVAVQSSPQPVTVLRAKLPLVKTWRAGVGGEAVEVPHSLAKVHTFMSQPVETAADLLTLVQTLERDPCCCVVLGQPAQHVVDEPHGWYRRLKADRDGDAATCLDAPTRLLVVDVDGAAELELEVLRARLGLADVECVVQWSGGMGFKPGARVKFLALLDEPVSLGALEQWAERLRTPDFPLDVSIYEPHQPIYLGAPVFEGGVADPFDGGWRSGLLTGAHAHLPASVVTGGRVNGSAVPEHVLTHTVQGSTSLAADGGAGKQRPEDPAVTLFKSAGLYVGPKGDGAGRHEVHCPWSSEHTDGRTEALLLERNYGGHDRANFRCLHDHCRGRGIDDVLALLNPQGVALGAQADGFFDRYTYVRAQNRYYDHETGMLLAPESFNQSERRRFRKVLPATAFANDARGQMADEVTFWPGRHDRVVRGHGGRRTYVNTWLPLDLEVPTDVEPAGIAPWLRHMAYLVPEPEHRAHVVRHMAFTLQHPDRKVNHGVLLGGPPRIGKDALLEPLKWAHGGVAGYVGEPTAEQLREQFDDFAYRKKVVVIGEVLEFEQRDFENRLKPLLAAPPTDLNLRLFRVGYVPQPNLLSVYLTTNHRDGLHVSEGDGRIFALWSDVERQPDAYYADLYRWLLAEGGSATVAGWLTHGVDLTGFDPAGMPPLTEFKRLLIASSRSSLEEAVLDLVESQQHPFGRDIVNVTQVHAALASTLKGANHKTLATAFRALGYEHREVKAEIDGKRRTLRLWAVREIPAWRAALSAVWAEHYLAQPGQPPQAGPAGSTGILGFVPGS